MVEAIREVRTGARTVPSTKETPLSVVEIPHCESFRSRLMSRVADTLVRAIADFGSGIGLDIVEGGGALMEWVYRRIDSDYDRYMEELKNGHAPRDLE